MPTLPLLTQCTTLPSEDQEKISTISLAQVLAARPAQGSPLRVESAYIHVPFCFHKCHYCDFYSFVDTRDQQGAFTERLVREIQAVGSGQDRPLKTLFIGGGTPTLLAPGHWKTLLAALDEHLPIASGGPGGPGGPGAEFTVEANPETLTAELVDVLVAGGVNRLSIGCQSFNPVHLKTLERWHDPANVERAVDIARRGGITNINLDLIFAIPGQTLSDWTDDLVRAVDLGPMHLSCYGLMYEPNTALTKRVQLGQVVPTEDDLEAEMYEAALAVLEARGFVQYEISNWSLPGRECRHNLAYWRNENWWALGPSASGHLDGLRWKNLPRLGDYLASLDWPPIVDVEMLPETERTGELLMLRLRLNEGVPLTLLDALLTSADPRRHVIARHEAAGLLERTDTHLRLTPRGRLLADSVLSDLVS